MSFKLNGTGIEKRTRRAVGLVMLIVGALYSSSTGWPKKPLAVWRESWVPGGDYFSLRSSLVLTDNCPNAVVSTP